MLSFLLIPFVIIFLGIYFIAFLFTNTFGIIPRLLSHCFDFVGQFCDQKLLCDCWLVVTVCVSLLDPHSLYQTTPRARRPQHV